MGQFLCWNAFQSPKKTFQSPKKLKNNKEACQSPAGNSATLIQ